MTEASRLLELFATRCTSTDGARRSRRPSRPACWASPPSPRPPPEVRPVASSSVLSQEPTVFNPLMAHIEVDDGSISRFSTRWSAWTLKA